MGKRRDSGRWILPGGSLDEGEAPEDGARRELREETGLAPKGELRLLDERVIGDKLHLYTYRCEVEGVPCGDGDPDRECGVWVFVDVSEGVPKAVAEHMMGPKDDNVLTQEFGLGKVEEPADPPPAEQGPYREPGDPWEWWYHSKPKERPRRDLGKAALPERAQRTKDSQPLKPTIILIRHGETDLNSGKGGDGGERLRGWLDVPLNDEGFSEAQKVAKLLARYPIGRIFCSDLIRAQQTAKPIAERKGLQAEATPSLRPWNLGAMHGRPLKEILPAMLHYLRQSDETPPDSTESFHQFQVRCIRDGFMPAMQYAAQHPEEGYVVLVAHSRNARLMRGWLMAGAKDPETIDKKPLLDAEETLMTGHLMVVQLGDDGAWHEVDDDDPGVEPEEGPDKPELEGGGEDEDGAEDVRKGYDGHGQPLPSPRGFVNPEGAFHPVSDEDHNDWIGRKMGVPDEAPPVGEAGGPYREPGDPHEWWYHTKPKDRPRRDLGKAEWTFAERLTHYQGVLERAKKAVAAGRPGAEGFLRTLMDMQRTHQRVQQLAASGKQAHVFASKHDPAGQLMVHRDTREPGMWRTTSFDGATPTGHTVSPDQATALYRAHEYGADIFNEVPQNQWKGELVKTEAEWRSMVGVKWP